MSLYRGEENHLKFQSLAKFPRVPLWRHLLPNKSHLPASKLTKDTSKGFQNEDSLWNALLLLNFYLTWTFLLENLEGQKGEVVKRTFAKENPEMVFLHSSFSFCVLLPYTKKKKKLPPFVEGMVQLHFLQSETSLFSILSRPQFPCLYVTNIPTEVAWGIKWRDPFNIQIKWKTITWCLHNMLIKKPVSQQWNQREKS